MSSCAYSPSERMCWIVRGGEERCGERCGGRCGKVCCGVGEMREGEVGLKEELREVWESVSGCRGRCEEVLGKGVEKCFGV